jgi:membrane protease YdiL (CAAX protease family)
MMKSFWPPSPLGLRTPLNLASLSPTTRPTLKVWLPVAAALGAILPPLILLLDRLLFAGASLERVRTVGALPFGTRIVIVLYSAVTEELLYRVVISTLLAWLCYIALSRETEAIWIGISIAAVLFGLAHVPNLAHVPHAILRAVVLNGIAGLLFGWLYWRKGLEPAVLAHLMADAVMYLVVPATLSP